MHTNSISTWTDWLWNITTMSFNLLFTFVVIVWSVWEHLSIGPALRNLSKPDKVLSLVNISRFSIGQQIQDTYRVLVLVNTYTAQQIQNTSRVLALEVSTDTSNMQSLGIIHVSTWESEYLQTHLELISRILTIRADLWSHLL